MPSIHPVPVVRPMPFVLDASVTLCWALDDESHSAASRALDALASGTACAPTLWWFEVRNILVVNERRKRIGEDESAAFLRYIAHLPIRIDREPVEGDVLRLARKHQLTVYAAAYLELALRNQCPLATLDAALAKAARAEGVPLLGDDPPRRS